MPLTGEYEPSTNDVSREQAEEYENSSGTKAATLLGVPIVVLTSRGAKTGKLRKTPLIRIEHNGEYAAAASDGGAERHPAWYYNVKADPHVELRDGAVTKDYVAREVFGEEKAAWWARAVEIFPQATEFQARTERQIPVFILTPR
ncbi:nitroreductase family deazaflavin-dependent oxidoreductase [Nocardia sp. CNY236]|uniref:nitroreductase family deazaflavin-dependent oxidoreductase n=1 Tax=Nocardia sp. CNY236 TaxID=1169152 RepID=UPI00040ADE12|nr:nitroreductase family deazaflavin-dependent oxidoreductase [Nocardia sp. CNY236]